MPHFQSAGDAQLHSGLQKSGFSEFVIDRAQFGPLRMRKTRLADQRDDMHCMSANNAVTLMKEAVDSAIKHGDIRLDAVAS